MSWERKKVLLLDIDGVLVRPAGYRASFRQAVNFFLDRLGLTRLRLESDWFAERFEDVEILAEWYMTPFILAMIFDYLLSLDPDVSLPADLSNLKPLVTKAGTASGFADYFDGMVGVIAAAWSRDDYPTEAVLNVLRRGEYPERLLPQIRRYENLCAAILSDALDMRRSIPLRVLETFVLGSDLYRKSFGTPCLENVPSCLIELDRPLITVENRDCLRSEHGKSLTAVGMTARPDRVSDSVPARLTRAFSDIPEAQCAFDALGWDGFIPILGVGTLNTFEDWLGRRRDAYLKPSAFHALAALFRSAGGETFTALEAAEALYTDQDPTLAERIIPKTVPLAVAVVEDSAAGVVAADAAVARLRSVGYDVCFFPFGVRTTDAKSKLLERAGAKLVPSVNEALAAFLAESA